MTSLLYAVAILVILTLSSAGCGKAVRPGPINPPAVKLDYAAPGTDPRCDCSEARAALLNNTTDTPRIVQTQVTVLDIPTKTRVDQFVRTDTVYKGTPTFLGCTIARSTPEDPQCPRENRFYIQNEVVVWSSTGLNRAYSDMGLAFANGPAACIRSCAPPLGPDSHCLALESDAKPLFTPLLSIANAASVRGVKTIPKAALLSEYGLSADADKCGRGNIEVRNGEITNSASDACDISTNDYSKVHLPVAPVLRLPKDIKALSQLLPSGTPASSASLFTFERGSDPPQLSFKGPHAPQLTRSYGGYIQGAEKVGDLLIITTSNGCVSVELR